MGTLMLYLFTSPFVLRLVEFYFVLIRAKASSKSFKLLIQSFFSFLDSLETKLGKADLEARLSPLMSTLTA